MDLKFRIMKTRNYIAIILALCLFASCEKDNYDAPNSFLTGSVTFNGESIQVRSDEVRFQIWQSGFGTEGPVDSHINQDGSFSSRLFNGSYRLVFTDGEGPFKTIVANQQQLDTIFLDLKGDTELNIEVLPYYMIRNAQFSKSGSNITASCSLDKIITNADAKNVERVTLYLNKTAWVSSNGDQNIAGANADISNLSAIDLSVGIPDELLDRGYAFARIGVKIQGVNDEIYSSIEKISL